jgi:hypothetical protein
LLSPPFPLHAADHFFSMLIVWSARSKKTEYMEEVQLTTGAYGHTLNSNQVFSPDDEWIVYDIRNDQTHISRTCCIEKVHVTTGEIVRLYSAPGQTEWGPGVGAASYHPAQNKIIFIHGLLNCDAQNPYGFARRFGAIWVRSSPDGAQVYFLMKDDESRVQIYSVSSQGGAIRQVTRMENSVQAQFNISPGGSSVALISDNSVWKVDISNGSATRLTPGTSDADAPVIAAVWNRNGNALTYNRYVGQGDERYLQIFRLVLN